jgi:hypothetical protein
MRVRMGKPTRLQIGRRLAYLLLKSRREGNRPLSDQMVSRARNYLFGSWEMNWIPYNYAHDVELPGSAYPQAETSEGRVDPFDPDNFKYKITVREIS